MPEYAYVHSTYLKNKEYDGVVVSAQDVDTGESKLFIKRNLKRTIGITKPELRYLQNSSKEYELLENLDQYNVLEKDLAFEIKKILKLPWNTHINEVYSNPYVYGADVEIESLIKMTMNNKLKYLPTKYTCSALDFETSVTQTGKDRGAILLASYVDDDFTVNTFFDSRKTTDVDAAEKIKKGIIEQFDVLLSRTTKKAAKVILKDVIDKGLKINVIPCIDEKDLILKLIKHFHSKHTSFCAIWNINFDIPKLLERMSVYDLDHKLLCHPDVPEDLRLIKYMPDEITNEFHLKWHWFSCSGYTQPIDTKGLFARVRKQQGQLDSYGLDFVAFETLGINKMSFGSYSFAEMETKYFIEYGIYNAVDSIITLLIEKVHEDLNKMCNSLSRDSLLSRYSSQTNAIRDSYYAYCKARNAMSKSSKGDQTKPWDQFIEKRGGMVLSPDYIDKDIGVKCINGIDFLTPNIFTLTVDCDVKAMYPSKQQAANISIETREAGLVSMGDYTWNDIYEFFGGVVAPTENAVLLCSKYLNLPSYSEMYDIMSNDIN